MSNVVMKYPAVAEILEQISPEIVGTAFKSTGLHQATKAGCVESARYFLSRGIDPNIHDQAGITPLMLAAHQGHIDVMRAMLNLGANIDDPISMYMADLLTVPASVAGLPAISLPCGFVDGLPCGLQIIGNYYKEKLILEVAGAYETNTEWHRKQPEVV